MAHSRSFLVNQKARNAIVGAENLLKYDSQEPLTIFDFSNEELDLENENSPNNDILGQHITTYEIHEQISKLKLKKSFGYG